MACSEITYEWHWNSPSYIETIHLLYFDIIFGIYLLGYFEIRDEGMMGFGTCYPQVQHFRTLNYFKLKESEKQ